MKLHADSSGEAVMYRNMSHCFRKTVAEEGFAALFKGLWPNYVKVVPAISIAFVTYEWVKDVLGVSGGSPS